MNSQFRLLWLSPTVATSLTLLAPIAVPAANNQILGWNNLGMHCMDSDYSVFSILPPYNTINAQLIVNGWPVHHKVGSLSVVAPDSMTADALGTTLFVLGIEEGMRFIESCTNAAALFGVREAEGSCRQIPSSRCPLHPDQK